MALVVLHRLLSHQIPEQHAEHCVRSQTQKDRTHAFVQAQHAFSLAHLQHTVWKPVVQTALEERKGCFFNCLHSVSAQPSVLFMHRSRDLIWRRQTKKKWPCEIHPLAGCTDAYWWHQKVSWWWPRPLHWSWQPPEQWAGCLDRATGQRDTLTVKRSSDSTSLSLHESQGEGNRMQTAPNQKRL